jgi:DNA-binding GntR family transcriptional regulator
MQIRSIPLFIQVAETIKSRIVNHEYMPGDSFPSAKELEKEFKVSNITIRRAIEQLTREGYLIPRRGMRAQVAEQTNQIVEIEITGDFRAWVDIINGDFRAWVDMATGRKFGITAEIIDRQVLAGPKPIREILALDPGEKVERIKRVRKLKKDPISYFVNYGPSRLFAQLPSREIERRTFIEAFQDVCKLKLKSMDQRVQATNADMDLARILQVEFGFPLFLVQNIYFSEKEIPLAVTHIYYRSDRYVYTIKRNL